MAVAVELMRWRLAPVRLVLVFLEARLVSVSLARGHLTSVVQLDIQISRYSTREPCPATQRLQDSDDDENRRNTQKNIFIRLPLLSRLFSFWPEAIPYLGQLFPVGEGSCRPLPNTKRLASTLHGTASREQARPSYRRAKQRSFVFLSQHCSPCWPAHLIHALSLFHLSPTLSGAFNSLDSDSD